MSILIKEKLNLIKFEELEEGRPFLLEDDLYLKLRDSIIKKVNGRENGMEMNAIKLKNSRLKNINEEIVFVQPVEVDVEYEKIYNWGW